MDDTIHYQHMDELRKELENQKQNEINNLQTSFANERGSFNNQIQQKQNEIDQNRISFETDRNNLNNQIQQKQNEINNLQNNFNNERNDLNSQVQQRQYEIEQIKNELAIQTQNVQEQNNTINNKDSELQNQRNDIKILQTDKTSLEKENIDRTNEISNLRKMNQELEKRNQATNESIIEKLSTHYDNYVADNEKHHKVWFIMVIVSFVILILSTVFSYFQLDNEKISTENPLINIYVDKDDLQVAEKIESGIQNTGNTNDTNNAVSIIKSIVRSLMFDFLAICFLWFCMNRYSYYTKLITEYKNRSIVSKSYLGVIYNTTDDNIRNETARIVADTLFSRCSAEIGNELPIKEAIKVVSDISKK